MDSRELFQAKSDIFKALGHPARLVIVEALGERPHCVCELVEMLRGKQATTSRHLDVLLKAGVVTRHKDGARMVYKLAMPCLLRTLPCVTEALERRVEAQARLLGNREAR